MNSNKSACIYISFEVEIMEADIKLLIRLKNLKREGFVFNYMKNEPEHHLYGYSLPFETKSGHIFLAQNFQNICFTREGVRTLQLHLMHPITEKLFNVMQRIYPKSSKKVSQTNNYYRTSLTLVTIFKNSNPLPSRFKESISPDKMF